MGRPAVIPELEHPNRINLAWLVRLRFATIAAQLITIAAVRMGMALPIPVAPLVALMAFELCANLVCIAAARAFEPQEWWLAIVMALDIVALTGLLYFTGGPLNPFSFLYLVPIALAAIMLPGAWTWALVMLALAGSAVLFASHRPLPLAGDHARHMTIHLQGMWVAFGVAAAFIVYFLLRVRRALEAREAELDAARGRAAREERLVSLATLAAGAAHELATPLSTIAVVAKDLERDLVGAGGAPQVLEDVRLVRRQVARCRDILARMRADAGEAAGESFAPVAVGHLVRQLAMTESGVPAAVKADVAPDLQDLTLVVPERALVQALRVLVENAHQASPAGAEVSVRVSRAMSRDGEFVTFEIRDRGPGIAPDLLARVGEPFFTTKPVGQGMGLGVFLARAVAERLGGAVTLESAPGQGTTAAFSIPAGAGLP